MSKYDTLVGERLSRIARVFADLERATKRLDKAKQDLPKDGALLLIADRLADHGDMYVAEAFLGIIDRAITLVSSSAHEADQAAQAIEKEKKK